MDNDRELLNEDRENDVNINENIEIDAIDQDVSDDHKKPENKKNTALKIISSIYDYAEVFAISIIAVIFVFSFCVRLCKVDGHSMNNTLDHGEMLISSNLFYTPKQGDIVVFHLINDYYNEPLVKRVIATEGQHLEIDPVNKVIKVDGIVYTDEHAYISSGSYKNTNPIDIIIPEGKIFVLGDNRNGSTDSRSHMVGLVDVDCILGRAVARLKPFTVFTE